MLKAEVTETLLYGCVTWTLGKEHFAELRTAHHRSLLGAWGFGAAPAYPRHPKSDSLLSDAGNTSLPLAAALRGGSAPSLALFANWCLLTLCVIRI